MENNAVTKICSALIELLQEKDISEISIKELVSTAKVSRSTYNYHFYDINDVLDTIFNNISHDIYSAIYGKPFEYGQHQHHFVIKYILEVLEKHKDEVRVLLMNEQYRQRLYQIIISRCEESAKRHKIAYLDDDGTIRTLQKGVLQDMYISQFCHAMIPRVEYYLSFDFEMPISEAIKVYKAEKKLSNQIENYQDKYLINEWQNLNY